MYLCRTLSSTSSQRIVGLARAGVRPQQTKRFFDAKITDEEKNQLLKRISPELRQVLETGSDSDLSRYIRNMSAEEVSFLLDDPIYKKKEEEWSKLSDGKLAKSFADSCVL